MQRPGRNYLIPLILVVFILPLLMLETAVAAPVLKSVRPLGAKRGTTFTLTLTGQNLIPGSELVTPLPAVITRLAPAQDLKTPETELPFLIELRGDAAVALYPIRLRSQDGISNLLLFSVSDFQEIDIRKPEAAEPSSQALRIVPPVVINSSLKQAERDVFRFEARRGQRLVFEVEARRMGSAIDPVIRVFDVSGREMAVNDDAPGLGVDSRLQIIVESDGEYRVAVHDSRYSEQEQDFYRLKVGTYPYAEALFPLGWQRGKDVKVAMVGGNLGGPVQGTRSPASFSSLTTAQISLPPDEAPVGSLPMPFVIGELPEILEPGREGPADLPSDTVVNGRISRPGERDLYRISVSPGEKWLFDLRAAALPTTRLSAYLGIHDSSMNLLASVVDASSLIVSTGFSFAPPERGVDPKTVFEVPENISELILAVEDIQGRGGPDYGYRLLASKDFEDFSLEYGPPFVNIPAGGNLAIPVRVQRDSYRGPIRLSLTNRPQDLTVEGGHVPAGAKEGLIIVSAGANPSAKYLDLEVQGEGISSKNEPIRRLARGSGLITQVKGARREIGGASIATQKPYKASWLGLQLPAGVSRPVPITLEPSEREIHLVQGLKHELRVNLARNTPGTGPVRVEGLKPDGVDVSIRVGTVEASTDSGVVTISAGPNAGIGRFDMVLIGRTEVGGREVVAHSRGITVDLVRAFSVVLPQETLILESGKSTTLDGKIHRQYPFQEAVRLEIKDLPIHVSANPVEVSASDSAFGIVVQADPAAEPGEYEVRLVAAAKMEGRKDDKDYTVPDKVLRIRIGQSSVSVERRGSGGEIP